MAKQLEITPELLASVKTLASVGFSKPEIAEKLKRDRNTLFYNNTNEELLDAINSAYNQGKEEHKNQLLNNMKHLATSAKNEDVQFKAGKYSLAVFHKIVEKQEIDANVDIISHKTLLDNLENADR